MVLEVQQQCFEEHKQNQQLKHRLAVALTTNAEMSSKMDTLIELCKAAVKEATKEPSVDTDSANQDTPRSALGRTFAGSGSMSARSVAADTSMSARSVVADTGRGSMSVMSLATDNDVHTFQI